MTSCGHTQTFFHLLPGFKVIGGIPNKTSTYNVKEGSYLYLKPPTIESMPEATFEWKFLQHGTLKVIEPSREYVSSDGGLLILSLNFVEHSDSIPVLFISTTFSKKNLLQYGMISITGMCEPAIIECPKEVLSLRKSSKFDYKADL